MSNHSTGRIPQIRYLVTHYLVKWFYKIPQLFRYLTLQISALNFWQSSIIMQTLFRHFRIRILPSLIYAKDNYGYFLQISNYTHTVVILVPDISFRFGLVQRILFCAAEFINLRFLGNEENWFEGSNGIIIRKWTGGREEAKVLHLWVLRKLWILVSLFQWPLIKVNV
jgi:hypothetical protein